MMVVVCGEGVMVVMVVVEMVCGGVVMVVMVVVEMVCGEVMVCSDGGDGVW